MVIFVLSPHAFCEGKQENNIAAIICVASTDLIVDWIELLTIEK